MYMELYLEQATQEVLRNFSKQHGQKIILMEKQILILTMIEIKVKQTYLDDAELEGSVIGQLQDAVAFVRNNSHRRWWKEDDYREDFFS